MSTIEVKVPDIGDFKDVPVIEVLVKPGDTVATDAPLVTLESDKATMEVPSPAAGTVRELKVKVGDKVSEGVAILVLDTATAATAAAIPATAPPAAAAAPAPASPAAPIPGAAAYAGKADIECELLVLGAGPGGYSAAFRGADVVHAGQLHNELVPFLIGLPRHLRELHDDGGVLHPEGFRERR